MRYANILCSIFLSLPSVAKADLTINTNLVMMESSDSSTGNINKNSVQFIHNFGRLNTFAGVNAGNFSMDVKTALFNTGLGVNALSQLTSASGSTAIGHGSLSANTDGISNTAMGQGSLLVNTIGNENTVIGQATMSQFKTTNRVSAFGKDAFSRIDDEEDSGGVDAATAIGYSTLSFLTTAITVNEFVAIGSNVAKRAAGNFTAIGKAALNDVYACLNTIAIGSNALEKMSVTPSISSDNIAIGANSFFKFVQGKNNVGVGSFVGTSLGSADNNIFLGSKAGSLSPNGSSNIYIAYRGSLLSEDNTVRIGEKDIHTRCIIPMVQSKGLGFTLSIDADGFLGIGVSSRRFKNNINTIDDSDSERIYCLTPVTFACDNDEAAQKQYGLIAEEVEKIFPELVTYDQEGVPFTVRYDVLPVLLLNEMKKQKQDLVDQKQIMEERMHRICALKGLVATLQDHVECMMAQRSTIR